MKKKSLKKIRKSRKKSRKKSVKRIRKFDGGIEKEGDQLSILSKRLNDFEMKIESIMVKFPNITTSVVQLVSFYKDIDPFSPHVNTVEGNGKGSGFIIDIDNGLILTNAHVVENSIYLYALTEKFRTKRIELKIISLCIEKDVALCQIVKEKDRKDIKGELEPSEINMKFADSFDLKHMDKVFVIGFPLGLDNIKVTGGTITGFYSNHEDGDNDIFIDEEDTSSYIETSAPVNKGNSGGPLININGEVIGIVSAFMRNAQNVNYVVGSRTILSIFSKLYKTGYTNKVLVPARYSFRYSKTSKPQLTQLKSDKEGIYVYKIYNDSSFFNIIKEGDIICKISFIDIYKNKNCFSNIINCDKKNQNVSSYEIKSDGFLVNKEYKDRKFILKEIFDSIPIGTMINFEIFRDGKFINNSCVFDNERGINSNRNKIVLSGFEPYKYVISYGLCIGELTMNHVFLDHRLIKFIEGENRYKSFLIINWVFPHTEASNLDIKKGTVISKVNGENVTKIDDKLKSLIKRSNDFLEIISFDGKKFVIAKDIEENKRIINHVNGSVITTV